MTTSKSSPTPIVVLCVIDGLRWDFVSESTTPNLQSKRESGISFPGFGSVFPSSTRICAATVATGAYPEDHGIIENELLADPSGERRIVSCADANRLAALPYHPTGTILEVPTMGQVLAQEGKRFFSACSGSSGTTYLANPAAVGACVNWEKAWPSTVQQGIANTVGFPGPESSIDERNRFIMDRALHAFQGSLPPDVCLLWFTEPDEAQHNEGIGSPLALAQLRTLDHQIEKFNRTLRELFPGRPIFFMAFSDHGCVTPLGIVDPVQELVAAGLKRDEHSTEIVYTSNSFFVREPELVAPLVTFLADVPWIERVFVRDDHWAEEMPASPLSEVKCNHPRAAEVMVSFSATSETSPYGTPGASMMAGNLSGHGSLSEYEMSIPLIIWGDGIRPNQVMGEADLTDIAEAVLILAGVKAGPTRQPLLQSLLANSN